MSLNKITPEHLSQYVNFYYGKSDWQYVAGESTDMPKLQAEGAAKVWNLLLDKEIALLADEVGMGKTIQALAVIATLWRQKPDAKVLLYAPNGNVALKWVNEYNNFINYHYRKSDEAIKSILTGAPTRNAIYVENHSELLTQWELGWPSFLIGKISSLSNFISPKISQELLDKLKMGMNRFNDGDDEKKLTDWMIRLGKKSNEKAYQLFGKDEEPPIDLLIIDEAHYLRRTDSETNRSLVARAFFNKQDNRINKENILPLAKRVLLLTATPNHSGANDINNIIGLFKPAFSKFEPEEILKELCVRRFRRLQNKTKHEYRDEIPDAVELSSMREKLFFAAYQKCLVEHQSQNSETARYNNPYRVLFGFLEGFEFLSNNRTRDWNKKEKKKIVTESDHAEDFEQREDTLLIRELSQIYQRNYKEPPKHPKYDVLIKQLSPLGKEKYKVDKRLVFVRRIPSVYEISNRLILEYDEWLFEFIREFLPTRKIRNKKPYNLPLRKFFQPITKEEGIEAENESMKKSSKRNEDDLSTAIPYSRVLDLFTIKKQKPGTIVKYKSTDCSNFRLRFTKADQIFSIFFHPASDYEAGTYQLKSVYTTVDNKKLYEKSAIHERITKIKDIIKSDKLTTLYELESPDATDKNRTEKLHTLIGLWWEISNSNDRGKNITLNAKKEYSEWTHIEKEGFSQYLEKGILHSSPFIVFLYSYYRKINKRTSTRGEELYILFCNMVRDQLKSSGLHELISNAILTFKIFYKKECAIKEEKLLNETWSFLNFTNPVYPYCGDTQRRSIIQAFNTPFFPNVLVATSVLQEGVDLHYQCDDVVHYGIAWTPGDNEQRVGRVDRMFGKLDIELKNNNNATLPIHYPFLSKTLDQDQLARFIKRKSSSEEMIDKFKRVILSKEVNLLQQVEEDTENGWLSLFKKPNHNSKVVDPFGVVPDDFKGIQGSNGIIVDETKNYIPEILNTLKKYYKNELVVLTDINHQLSSSSFASIKHIRINGRHQPILFELNYYEQGIFIMGHPVYCLSIKTPLGKSQWDYYDRRNYGVLKDVYQQYQSLKICVDESVKKSHFRIYCKVDLVLLSRPGKMLNISSPEIKFWVDKLIYFSDELEDKVTGGRDILNDEVLVQKNIEFDHDRKLDSDRAEVKQMPGWKVNDDKSLFYKSKLTSNNEDLMEVFRFNHINYFIRKINIGEDTCKEVCLYRKDALSDEFIFYNSIL